MTHTTLTIVLSDASHRHHGWARDASPAEVLTVLADAARFAKEPMHGAVLTCGLVTVSYDARECAALVREFESLRANLAAVLAKEVEA